MKRYLCPTGEGECRHREFCVEFDVAICDMVRESCAASGVPVTITDPQTIATIARLLS